MSGATVSVDNATASDRVRVEADPKPPRTPLVAVALPGVTIRRLEPSEEMALETLLDAPCPSPTVRMTAATPISRPRTVRQDRKR